MALDARCETMVSIHTGPSTQLRTGFDKLSPNGNVGFPLALSPAKGQAASRLQISAVSGAWFIV